MQITKQQITALALQYATKLGDKIKKENAEKAKKEDIKNLSEAKKLYSIYKTIPKKLLDMSAKYSRKELSVNYILEQLRSKQVSTYIKLNDIENKIIIASIDSKTMEDLERKLKF